MAKIVSVALPKGQYASITYYMPTPDSATLDSAHSEPATRRNYVLALVTLIYVVNYINRQILNILLPQIKAEFQLTDTQLGLLAGPVFAVVYAVLGLPLAAIADRVSRRNLIAVTLSLFSAATFVCGYISSFVELL